MIDKIEKALDIYARPALREHLGDIRVTRVEDGIVYVRLLGQCAGCASAYATLDQLIEKVLCEHVPGVKKVLMDSFDMDLYQYAKQLRQRDSNRANTPQESQI